MVIRFEGGGGTERDLRRQGFKTTPRAADGPQGYDDPNNPKVYNWGGGQYRRTSRGQTWRSPAAVDHWVDSHESRGQRMLGEVDKMSSSQLESLRNRLEDAGLVPEHATIYEVRDAWQNMVVQAANMTGAGNATSPWDVLAMHSPGGIYGGGGGGGGGGPQGFTGTRHFKSKQVDLTDPHTARRAVDLTFRQMIGRKPHKDEFEDFVSALHSAERDSPVVQKRTVEYKDGIETSSNTTTHGGLSGDGKQDVLEGELKDEDSKEYRNYQAATTYWNALLAAIEPTV